MGMLLLVSVFPTCVFPLLPRSFYFELLLLLLALLVAPVIDDGRDEDDDEMLVLSYWNLFWLWVFVVCRDEDSSWANTRLCVLLLSCSPRLSVYYCFGFVLCFLSLLCSDFLLLFFFSGFSWSFSSISRPKSNCFFFCVLPLFICVRSRFSPSFFFSLSSVLLFPFLVLCPVFSVQDEDNSGKKHKVLLVDGPKFSPGSVSLRPVALFCLWFSGLFF